MRNYYAFKIKKEFYNLYKDNPSSLYNILKHLYYMRKCELTYGFNLFKQITMPILKNDLDKKIYIKYHNEMTYSKNGDDHIINNLYKDEVSILTIKKSYILINANKNYSSFFKILNEYNNDFFVCDFTNQDYFFISNIKDLSKN